MTIAIDASRLTTTKNPTGVEVYCHEIIFGLLKKSTGLLFYAPKLIAELPRENQKILRWPSKFWSQIRLAFELIVNPPDVFFTPGYVIPFLALTNKKTRKIVTIHDVAFVYAPKSYSFFERWFLKTTTKEAVKYAHKIIVPTKTTRDDLINFFHCPAEKIMVTYLGISNQKSEIRNQGAERKKQILFIGRIESKKNIGNLIAGFQLFNKKFSNYKLILAGKAGVGFENTPISQYPISNIQYLGYISPERKQELLEKSSCLVLISRYEGFGFPLLEAFAHNLPVVASNIPALKEIGSDACLFVDPDNINDIAAGLEKIITNENLRQKLIALGQERLSDFSWDKCINETWQILICQ